MKHSTFFFIIMVLGIVGIGVMHERVHVEIYRTYGLDSHVEYLSHFPDFITIADGRCPTDECRLANNINEAVTYPLIIFYIVLMLGIMSLIKIQEEK